jgi:hypothetical protein
MEASDSISIATTAVAPEKNKPKSDICQRDLKKAAKRE